MDMDHEGHWLTFAELAASRGITKLSATKLVRRRKWRRQADNHGTVRVLVPPGAEDSPPTRPPARQPGRQPGEPSDTAHAISALEAAIAALRDRAEAAEQGRVIERVRADQLRDQVETLRLEIAELKAATRAPAIESAESGRRSGLIARLLRWSG